MENTILNEIELSLEESRVSFNDIETLEEMVTPGCGGGCDCSSSGCCCKG